MTAGMRGAATFCPGLGPGVAATQCGIALEADVGLLLSSEPMFVRLSGQVGDALGRRIPLSLRLSGLSALDGETFSGHSLSTEIFSVRMT